MDERDRKDFATRLADRNNFERLYANWLRARYEGSDPDHDESDEAFREREDRLGAATRELVSTPAILPWMVWKKWEAMELDLCEDLRDGARADYRLVVILGCIKADLIRLGIGEGD